MLKLKSIKKYNRLGLFLILSVLAGIFTQSLLWMPLALLAVFFGAIDIFQIDQKKSPDVIEVSDLHIIGVLDNYVVDSTASYGLFIKVLDRKIFVDMKEDNLIKERESYANYIIKNIDNIETSLRDFMIKNPEYLSRELVYIGLHSKEKNVGEVFWEPEGYSKLRDLQFTKT